MTEASELARRYERVHALFEGARSLADDERRRFLDERCGDDPALRTEVEELLAALEGGTLAALSEEGIAGARGALEGVLNDSGGARGRDDWLPERIGRYRVLRQLAQGGMGVVYEAEQDAPRRRIALKVVHPLFVTPARLARFRQEAELLGRLEHPGIARIYEAGTFDAGRGPQPYFAMELIEGGDLASWVEERKLPVAARMALLAEICDAVEHAHAKGVVHRDLKPDNVLVDEHGRPKVLDFGVARASEGSTVLTTMVTNEGDLIGTIAYMAPEQLDGAPDAVTPRSDVYALGVIAFQLLAGRLPHDLVGLPLTVALHIVREDDPARLAALRPELAGDLDTIVGKALEKDPERRFSSAAALAEDLRAFLDHRPIAARPPTRTYRLRKFARRNKALVGGSTATLAAIVLGLVVSLVFATRAERSAEQARDGERRAVAGVLQATQDLLERGDVWRAALTYRSVDAARTAWELELVERALPALLPVEYLSLKVVWLDDRHVAVPSLDGDGAVVFDADTLAPTGRLLPGRRVLPMGTDHRDRGWWIDADDQDEVFEVDPRTLRVLRRHRLPAARSVTRSVISLALASGSFLDFVHETGSETYSIYRDGERLIDLAIPTFENGLALPSPDGRLLAVFDAATGRLRVLETDTGASRGELADLRRSSCPRLWFQPDSRHLLTFDAGFRLVTVDTDDMRIVRRHESIVGDSCSGGDPSADGTLFAHAPPGEPVEVHELSSGRLVFSQRVSLIPGAGHHPRLSPDASRLIAAAQDRGACLVDRNVGVVEPEALGTDADPRGTIYRGHERFVYDVAIAPDGRMAASSSIVEPVVRLWDLASGRTLATLDKPVESDAADSNRGHLLAFTPDGRRLVATSRDGFGAPQVLEWDLVTGESGSERLPLPQKGGHAECLDRFLELLGPAPPMRLGRKAFLLEDGTALALQQPTWDRVPEGERWTTFIDRNEELALDLSPDRTRVAVGAQRTVRIYDRASRTVLASFAGHAYAVAWSPDGRLVAAGGNDGRIRLIDGEFLIEVLSFAAHDDYVFALAWTPDGSRLVSTSGDATVRVWDPRRPSERADDLRADEERLAPLRALSTEELLRRLDAATNVAERGALVRVVLERRAG